MTLPAEWGKISLGNVKEASLTAGALLVILGVCYVYRPNLILRMNAVLRENVFSDALVVSSRKKVGLYLVLLGLVGLIAGFMTL